MSNLSSEAVMRLPSLFQSPYVTFFPCLEIHGIFLFVLRLKNTTEPFSEPIARTGCVVDHEIKEALSLVLASSISYSYLYPIDQIETVADAVRIASESLSLSHSSASMRGA